MSFEIALTAIAAGMVYVLVPGPATLAVLGLSASRGRGAAGRFLLAHLLGDLTWSVLALFAIIGVSQAGPELFEVLGIACGAYLIWLGWKALKAPRSTALPIATGPALAGLMFGLTNPKAYPFALAMFTTLLGRHGEALSLEAAPALIACSFAGFVIADLLVIGWTGLPSVGRLFARFERPIVRATGILFVLFGVKSIGDAVTGLRGRT